MLAVATCRGSHLSLVATCRQTVEVFSRAAVHRLGADGYEEP